MLPVCLTMHELDRFTHVLHLQGTNRPGRYNVLVDDCSLGPDGLQLITQHLASTYAACTRCGTAVCSSNCYTACCQQVQPWVLISGLQRLNTMMSMCGVSMLHSGATIVD
jgi:hypothetical protein